MKRFLYYFAWTIAIGLVLYLGMQVHDLVFERSRSTFEIFPIYLFNGLFPVFVGLLMGMPKFILQLRRDAPWMFDWIVFIAVCLPALLLVSMTLIPFTPLSGEWLIRFSFLFTGQTTIPTIAGVVFGYALMSCFKKTDAAEWFQATEKRNFT
ncbi:MAG TPA: hypothetical protein VK947_00085 [Planococcus sp. (in: firmicutes)]|nr:hypothetical protein [Planococcus sp. (in: firmicutes)]